MMSCTNCYASSYSVTPLVTHYRVETKILIDQVMGKSNTFHYSYDEPANNDAAHSALIANPPTGSHYYKAYNEFRGHAAVMETGPDGKVTKTFFYQDDNRKGNPAATIIGTNAFSDPFDVFNSTVWTFYNAHGSYPNIVTLAGDDAFKMYNPAADWNVTLYRNPQSIQNTSSTANTVLVQFRLSGATTITILALQDDTYPYPDSRWARWSITVDGSSGTVKTQYYLSPTNGPNETTLLTGLKLDHWYVLQLSADNHQMLTRVWDRDNPSIKGEYACSTASGGTCNALANRSWRFDGWTYNGTTWLDDYSEGRIYTNDIYEYSTTPITLGSGHFSDLKINWTYLVTETHQTFEGSANWTGTKKFNHYDASDQGGAQYGNLTRTVESYWNGSVWSDYRNTYTRYYPPISGTPYLVSLPGFTNQYYCPTGSQDGSCYNTSSANYLLTSKWYLYDGSILFSTQPSIGKLTGERDFVCFADSNNNCYPGYNPSYTHNVYSDKKYDYDSYGNLTSNKKYSVYGWWQGSSNSIWAGGESAITTTFDPNYHTYPIAQVNPLGQVTNWKYDFALGVPISETLPNGGTTTAAYDAYGRMATLRKPGDESGRATMGFGYFDSYPTQNGAPFMIDNQNRIDGDNPYNNYRKFYDSFGNQFQVQTARSAVNGASMDVVVDYGYDAYGRAITQTVPYSITAWYSGLSATPYRGTETHRSLDTDHLTTSWEGRGSLPPRIAVCRRERKK